MCSDAYDVRRMFMPWSGLLFVGGPRIVKKMFHNFHPQPQLDIFEVYLLAFIRQTLLTSQADKIHFQKP